MNLYTWVCVPTSLKMPGKMMKIYSHLIHIPLDSGTPELQFLSSSFLFFLNGESFTKNIERHFSDSPLACGFPIMALIID